MVSDRNQTIIRERCSLWKSGVHSLKGEYHAPNELLYTKEHEWVRLEADKCRIGVTDYAQASLHEIVYVDLPKVDAKVAQMQSLGTVESVKAVADVYSPIAGVVLEVNKELSDPPEPVNKRPYEKEWTTVTQAEHLKTELPSLMKPEPYRDFVNTITEKK